MTPSERSKLVMSGCDGALVIRMDGLGWSFADIQLLISSGLDFSQIESLLNIGVSYADIKTVADELKRQAKNKKIADVGNALFGQTPNIISNIPSIQNSEPLKITAKIFEKTVQGLGKAVFWGIGKARK